MQSVKSPQPMVQDQTVSPRKDDGWAQGQERDRAGFRAVGVDSGEERPPPEQPSGPGCGTDRAGQLDPGDLGSDHRIAALEQQGSKLVVVWLVREVGSQDGACVGVEEGHRRRRSAARASLAERPAPRVDAMAAFLDGGRRAGRGITWSPADSTRERTWARSSELDTALDSSSVTRAFMERPSTAARSFSRRWSRSSIRVMSCRTCA
jgi:hypothetical protein